MIDHVLLEVYDLKKSKAFYEAALKPLGISLQVERAHFIGFGTKRSIQFFLSPGKKRGESTERVHLAFLAQTRKCVDQFHEIGIKRGGKSNGEPGIRIEHDESYYSAFVLDPSGNNIEAVYYDKLLRRKSDPKPKLIKRRRADT